MSIIFVLIPLAIIIVSIAIGVFFWAVKSNQFDDLERQGYSILFDDDIKPPAPKAADKQSPELEKEHIAPESSEQVNTSNSTKA